MNIAVCGLNCDACEHLGQSCNGCHVAAGKVFWAQYTGQPACPVYACAAQRGLPHCGPCADIPCAIWATLREDHVSDEEHAQNLATRQRNLKALADGGGA